MARRRRRAVPAARQVDGEPPPDLDSPWPIVEDWIDADDLEELRRKPWSDDGLIEIGLMRLAQFRHDDARIAWADEHGLTGEERIHFLCSGRPVWRDRP